MSNAFNGTSLLVSRRDDFFPAHFFLGDIFLAAARPPTNMTAPSATVVVAVLNTIASAETASVGTAAAGPTTTATAVA